MSTARQRDLNAMEGDSLAWVHPSCPNVITTIDASTISVASGLPA